MNEEQEEYGYCTFKIKGYHFDTGETIILHESIYTKILENYLEYYKKTYSEYKIFIE